jgi:hypothetical protein
MINTFTVSGTRCGWNRTTARTGHWGCTCLEDVYWDYDPDNDDPVSFIKDGVLYVEGGDDTVAAGQYRYVYAGEKEFQFVFGEEVRG